MEEKNCKEVLEIQPCNTQHKNYHLHLQIEGDTQNVKPFNLKVYTNCCFIVGIKNLVAKSGKEQYSISAIMEDIARNNNSFG